MLVIQDEQARNDIMLRYSSVLIKKIPTETLNVLKQPQFRKIDIPKLIPAFMNIEKGRAMDEALRYIMDNCIKRIQIKDKTVHNLAMYFLAQRDKPDELLDYLKKEEVRKAEGHAIYFEVDYALNVCKQKEKDMKDVLERLRGGKKAASFIKDEDSLKRQINQMKKA